MAVLRSLPSMAIIRGFKGKLDFYVHDGVPCARKWPRSPGQRRAPAVEAQWPIFAEASRIWSQTPEELRVAFNMMASGTSFSGRDLAERAYISGLMQYPHDV